MSRLQKLQKQKWDSRSLPIFTTSPERLASALFRQHFFISLYRACAESLASENASRLASMQIAEKNIQERLGELKTHFQQERQTAITEELLDIVSGFEALRNERD
jgi:F-type H+-transporting ATPase subunit gamma